MSRLEEYKKHMEELLELEKSMLEPLEKGEFRISQSTGNDPLQDTTDQWIAKHRQGIAYLESLIAKVTKDIAG